MRYVVARWQESQRELAYRIYVSDSLYAIGRQQGLKTRWWDMISQNEKTTDEPPAEAIIQTVMATAGLRFKDERI